MKKKILSFSSMIMCILVLSLCSFTVQAADKKPVCEKKKTMYYSTMDDARFTYLYMPTSFITIGNMVPGAKITNLKSSNNKFIVFVYNNPNSAKLENAVFVNEKDSTMISVGKTYSTTISFKVKQKGKTYPLSCKVTIKPLPSQFQKIKIGKTDYIKSHKRGNIMQRTKKIKGTKKISVVPIKGVVIDTIRVIYLNGNKYTMKKVKNNQSVSFTKVCNMVIEYHHSKPKYYKAPTIWHADGISPLHYDYQILFE